MSNDNDRLIYIIKNTNEWFIGRFDGFRDKHLHSKLEYAVSYTLYDAGYFRFMQKYADAGGGRNSVSVAMRIEGIGANIGPIREFSIVPGPHYAVVPSNVGLKVYTNIVNHYSEFIERSRFDDDTVISTPTRSEMAAVTATSTASVDVMERARTGDVASLRAVEKHLNDSINSQK